MLKIRLKRVGRKHDPSFRVVVTEKGRGPTSGRYVENLGSYDARKDEHNIDTERAAYWLDNGAQPSETVHNLLVDAGVIDGEKVNPLPQKSPVVQEEPEEEAEADDAEATDEEASEGASAEDESEEGEGADEASGDEDEKSDSEDEADSEDDSDEDAEEEDES